MPPRCTPGQAVPDGAALARLARGADRVGLPAGRTGRLQLVAQGPLRRHAAVHAVLVYLPLGFGGFAMLLLEVPLARRADRRRPAGPRAPRRSTRRAGRLPRALLRRLVVRLLFMVTVPRLLNLAIQPDTVYPLVRLPLRHPPGDRAHDQQPVLQRALSATAPTSSPTCAASGTSSRRSCRPGRTSATSVKHENPYLSAVGSGTVVADGLSIINADYSSTSFRVSRTSIGAQQLPRQRHRLSPRRAGPATTACWPPRSWSRSTGRSGKGVGLLGSPSFEIPRTRRAGRQVRPAGHAGGDRPPARRQEPLQPRHHGVVPAGRGGSTSSWSCWPASPPSTSTPRSGRRRSPLVDVLILAVQPLLLLARRTSGHGLPR